MLRLASRDRSADSSAWPSLKWRTACAASTQTNEKLYSVGPNCETWSNTLSGMGRKAIVPAGSTLQRKGVACKKMPSRLMATPRHGGCAPHPCRCLAPAPVLGVDGPGRVRSRCRFRKRGTECLSKSGRMWLSCRAKRQRDRTLPGRRAVRLDRRVSCRRGLLRRRPALNLKSTGLTQNIGQL
jgi:hypothetical protein